MGHQMLLMLENNMQEGLVRIDEHQIRLDAIRIILTTKPE